MSEQGFFSVLRWCTDPTRDEARNVAVVLVGENGAFGGVRAAPLSSVSSRLQDQGILDSAIAGLEQQFSAPRKPSLGFLDEMHASLHHSLYFTEPKATAVGHVDLVLHALYRAYVQPRGGGGQALTKGRLLDQVVGKLRRRGFEVRRGTYVKDYLFDAVVENNGDSSAIEVLSFATGARNWTAVEHDAGHFLHAVGMAGLRGVAVVQPPGPESVVTARESWARVTRWFHTGNLPVTAPTAVEEYLAGVQRLDLGG